MKTTKLYGYEYNFSMDCDSIGVDNILDLHKYLMKNYDIKQFFGLLSQLTIALLSFSKYLTTKCISLNIGLCMTSLTFVDLDPVELDYYPFIVSLDKCNGSCSAVDNLSTKLCVLSEAEDLNVRVFNMITRIN